MKALFIETEFAYDGTQLRSLFAYLEHRVHGDSVVSWIGACDIPLTQMVDGEDVLDGATIAGSRMVHFIVEKFNASLLAGVALQRLFAAICLDLLREQAPQAQLRREGDDLYFKTSMGDGKLSISIATVSPVSSLIHFAVNCSNVGTPVKTASLEDLGVDAKLFARTAMARLVNEVGGIDDATMKVRWVN